MAKPHTWPDEPPEIDAEPQLRVRANRGTLVDYDDPRCCLTPLPHTDVPAWATVRCGRTKHINGKHLARRYDRETRVETTWQWR